MGVSGGGMHKPRTYGRDVVTFKRDEIIREFVRLSEGINSAEAAESITREEAVAAIEAYRERADTMLDALKQTEKVKS